MYELKLAGTYTVEETGESVQRFEVYNGKYLEYLFSLDKKGNPVRCNKRFVQLMKDSPETAQLIIKGAKSLL